MAPGAMASEANEHMNNGAVGGAGADLEVGAGATAAISRSLHQCSFKLRFAAEWEPGRSYVSLVKPLGLPDTVTGKFYCREQPTEVDKEATERALQRIQDMFERGPREKYSQPVTTSQVYGWHAESEQAAHVRADRRLSHHLRDSAWLRARLLLLAHDERLAHR